MRTLRDVGNNAVHLCIDMQKLFAEGSPWAVPWMERTLPQVLKLAEHVPERTIFTRFITPRSPDEAGGMWRTYYRKWENLTRDHVDESLFELLTALQPLVPPAHVIDRYVYSAFGDPRLHELLREHEVDTLVFSGSEIDVCVLSSVYAAMDLGYRIIVAEDAVSSSSDASHDAITSLLARRFDIQIELAKVEEIIARW
jgi:nicotinamidase-related amidase